MIVGSLAELEAYFESLWQSYPGSGSFVTGDSHKIVTLDRSSLTYPVLWLETPEVDWNFSNKYQREYKIAFVILWNSPPDNWQRVRFVKSRSLDIVDHLLRWMQQDKEEVLLDYESLRASSYPIAPWGHDNDVGWRTELGIRTPISYCPEACKRQNVCPVGTLAKFSWHNANHGDFTGLGITNLTLPEDEDWDFEWTWQINDNPVETSTDDTPFISEPGDYILISLKITLGGCTRYASAFFSSAGNCGESVPYLLTKIDC